jgi:hypothetical protein
MDFPVSIPLLSTIQAYESAFVGEAKPLCICGRSKAAYNRKWDCSLLLTDRILSQIRPLFSRFLAKKLLLSGIIKGASMKCNSRRVAYG